MPRRPPRLLVAVSMRYVAAAAQMAGIALGIILIAAHGQWIIGTGIVMLCGATKLGRRWERNQDIIR
jgi:hypothetical protein